ncbi:MAG: hypothetical protein KDK37_14580 [Leptospiraceae bacterium]|nr:hypothetical protein [Leptospiraceae bacterium]
MITGALWLLIVAEGVILLRHYIRRIRRIRILAREIQDRIAFPRWSGRPDEWMLQDIYDLAEAIRKEEPVYYRQPFNRPISENRVKVR